MDLLAAGADHIEGTATAEGHEGVSPMVSAQGSHGLGGLAGYLIGSGGWWVVVWPTVSCDTRTPGRVLPIETSRRGTMTT